MADRIRGWLRAHPYARWFYPACLIVAGMLFWLVPIAGNRYIWLYLGGTVLLLFACRPSSALHALTMENASLPKALCSTLVALITIAVCVLPMGQLSIWNGEIPDHRDQYERMAEAILDGRLDLNYGDEEALAQLENPYDPAERDETGVHFHWDHAYYDGHYYMYFGVVPVFLAFLPYRLVTGTALTTFHATQLFTAVAIAGIFVLFHLLAKRFFQRLPYSVYLALAVAFSIMSVWYATAEPALYCTAITAAIALEVWSLYFFIRAVWVEQRENRQLLLAGIGALLGALVFGCRPPIALANLLVIPMLAVFLRQRKITLRLLGKLALAALPYVLVAAALMLYNYARFDDPFEFGQAYQLTVADQTQYRVRLDPATILRLVNETAANFFSRTDISAAFPYLSASSVFFNFPILLLGAGLFRPSVLKSARDNRLLPLVIGLVITVLVITVMDILWTPYLLERYRMDIYFLLGISCFIVVGLWHASCTPAKHTRFAAATVVLAVLTIVSALLFCVDTVGHYYPEEVTAIAQALGLNG